MILTWYGHSCFKFESSQGSAVFDPYAPDSVPGLSLPALSADAVICSHSHADHGCAQAVKPTGNRPGFSATRFETFHDREGGKLRGRNTMTLIEADGQRILHMGDLGHELSGELISDIGRVDVLMIPVGGHYTIDARQADNVSRALGARLVVPMHYRGACFGYDVIAPVKDFLKLRDNVLELQDNVINTELYCGQLTIVPKCPR